MVDLINVIRYYLSGRGTFIPSGEMENGLFRLTIIHSIGAFIIAPLFSIFIINTQVPVLYFYLGISYTILFPFYILLCWSISSLHDKFIYFFITHLFVITYLAFDSLLENQFEVTELFCFFGLYTLSVVIIQRWYPIVLYIIFVFLALLYGFLSVEGTGISQVLIATLFTTIGLSGAVVMYFRLALINTLEDYSEYLKKIMNNSGIGYVLFEGLKNKKIVDYNEEACRTLNLISTTQNEIENTFFSVFTEGDIHEIEQLNLGNNYTFKVDRTKFGIKSSVQVDVSLIAYKKKTFLLATANDVTSHAACQDEFSHLEKKYKNLYYINKAGVFTLDKNSIILDGNDAFFNMFESTLKKGDRLFSIDNSKDWNLIVESFGNKETTQNYQTKYSLLNGNEKTFVFSWYIDIRTYNIEGSVVDLTNIQNASKALKQSEEKYRIIYEDSNDAILLLDGDEIIDVNRKTIQLFGLPQKELLNMNLYNLSADKNESSSSQYIQHKENLTHTRGTKFDWIFEGNNGLIEAEVSLIEIMLGNKVYYQCVIHNTTEQNKNLRAIEKNKRNLENILENNPEGILIVRGKKVLFTNPEINNLLGRKFDFEKLFLSSGQEKFNNAYSEHLINKSRQNLQLYLANTSNEELLMDITIVSTNYEEEEASLIIMKDVSVQNILAKEKLRAELAEETNKKLAREIMERIKAEKLLEDQFLRTKAILDSSSNTFLLTLSHDAEISSYNMHCDTYFTTIFRKKIKRNVRFTTYFKDLISPVQLRLFKILFHQVRKGKSRQLEVKMDTKGEEYWLEIFMNPIFDTAGDVAEISIVAHDISDKKITSIRIVESLKEKKVLLKEIHHRVKNNLQVISSILNLQSSFVSDENTLEILQESRNRIRSMAIIHENLYRTEDFSSINFSSYLENLTANLISSYRIGSEIILNTNLEEVDLTLDQAIPCGLLVNELITNALKYAWNSEEIGTITINLSEIDGIVNLEISDNGVGLPFIFEEVKSDTLGLQLVVTLVEQLDGEIITDCQDGTKYLIKFGNIKPRSNV